jgi:hypothetical protein
VNASPCAAHCELFNNLKNHLLLTRFDPQNLVSNVLSFTKVLTPKMKLGLDSIAIKKNQIFEVFEFRGFC